MVQLLKYFFSLKYCFILFTLLFSVLYLNITYGQISISPEVGFSYSPFEISLGVFHSGPTIVESNRLEFLIGFSAQFSVHERWFVKTRLTYNKQETANWKIRGEFYNSDFEFEHNNINIDITINYKIAPRVHIGLGPSMIRKFDSVLTIENEHGEDKINKYNKTFSNFGLSGGISYDFSYFGLNVDYMQVLDSKQVIYRDHLFRARSRLNATISIPIRFGKKR